MQEQLLPNSNPGSDEEGERELDDDYIEDYQPTAKDVEEAQIPLDPAVRVRDFADGLAPIPPSRSTSNSSSSHAANSSRPTLQVFGHSSQSNQSGRSGHTDASLPRRHSNTSSARTDSGTYSALSTEESSTADGDDDSTTHGRSLGGLGLSKAAKQAIKRKRSTRSFLAALVGNMAANASNPLILARAAVWASAICTMHYTGMLAMQVEEGFIRWNFWLIAASYVVAFVVCMVAVSFCT